MYNQNFDPLATKYGGNEEVVIKSIKREIQNILSSYVGWFDPFCELIQNALDALDARVKLNEKGYKPIINVFINIQDNTVAVTDNGIGFEEQQYLKFLAPNFSFKSGNTRGHKGVGSTYLAYGFNYIQISTKSKDFSAVGKMLNAKKWLSDESPASNPMVIPDKKSSVDSYFDEIDRGVSVAIKYDTSTYPKDLSWIKINTAENWLNILRIKTGLGALIANPKVLVKVKVINKSGLTTTAQHQGIEYLWINEFLDKSQNYTDIKLKMDFLYRSRGEGYRLPTKYKNLNAIYDMWDYHKLATEISLSDTETEINDKCTPMIYFAYVYSTKVWEKLNSAVGIRSGNNAMAGGIQLAANNMPQGELILIPLKKNAGRQFQLHIVIHFNNCVADLGRKGFQKDIVEFSKSIARKIADGPLMKVKKCFKRNSGAVPDLMREQSLDDWKNTMKKHEDESPLKIKNKNFFLPSQKISMTSIPTREQDVIALFNQLLAGGVIRGIKIMSTNERFTYDGLYHIAIDPPFANHIYDGKNNPLGVKDDVIDDIEQKYPEGFYSDPKVLEYKFSLDGLIEDISSGVKATKDINLVVAWEAGEMYKENFYITSLLLFDNMDSRQYHGITHRLFDITTNEVVCDIILLKDLIQYLNDPQKSQEEQQLYEE